VEKTVYAWEKPVGLFIPHMVEKRKPEVLGARDAEATLYAQTRAGMCHECLDRLPPA
jgi:hypothetical protein